MSPIRVSDHYNLGVSQGSLDFLDVPIDGDVKLFIDPGTLRTMQGDWFVRAHDKVHEYFQFLIELLRSGDLDGARLLLATQKEPSETHLGFCESGTRGVNLGHVLATDVLDGLSRSQAIQTGLLKDLEETALMVPNISSDRISDITTNIIRDLLIEYTKSQCDLHGIPLVDGIASGPLWNDTTREWSESVVSMPRLPGSGKLLLVPRSIIRSRLNLEIGEYYRDFIFAHLCLIEEQNPASSLVKLLKNGKRKVMKKELQERYPKSKQVIQDISLQNPELLRQYRDKKTDHPQPPLSHEQLSDLIGTPLPDWDALMTRVRSTPSGSAHATEFHRAASCLLSCLFCPSLANLRIEAEIHSGRKRIDILFDNVAQSPSEFELENNIFVTLRISHHFPIVFVECKNYSADVSNPELDQLAGRFGARRGSFGLLICSKIENKELFMARCLDTARDGRGYIVPLDVDDLQILVDSKRHSIAEHRAAYRLIEDRFHQLRVD